MSAPIPSEEKGDRAVTSGITDLPNTSSTTSEHEDDTTKPIVHDEEKQTAPTAAPTGPPGPPGPPGRPGFPPPPNGGRVAWTQVLCAHLMFFNTFGILTTFGVYQAYYESTASPFKESHSNISWIGCIQVFLVQFIGCLIGPIYDKGYVKTLLSVGTFLIVFGHMMLSLATTFWQHLLAQSFCIGLGMGCLFVPSISLLPPYFSTKLGLAIGIASAGSSTGGVIYPIIMQRLIAQVGFGWAVRTAGFVALVTLVVPVLFTKQRVKPPKSRAIIDQTVFKDVNFLWFAVATSIGFIGLTSHQIYFAYYAKEQGISSTDFAFNLVSIYNGVALFGRIVPNAISDKVGQFNILAPSVILTGVVVLCTLAVHSQGPLIGTVIVVGFFCGVLTALPPVCFAILTPDKTKLGTRIGIGYVIVSFGVLISGPSAGAILQRSSPLNWLGLFTFSGVALLVAGFMYAGLRVKRSGPNPFIKA